ncbi:hypothetical protein HJC23_013511 [Cyclotella cryptica]|uniref:EGF-like domain-containing protein n=1 Tax=Cyclotella cryptica TaxID=29204 RepID=A0ABD3QBE2_9STRA|eukprot:CCRYP_006952-RA/>CCRYP_006952-RA protein AED:0.03 eAED:0.03 QI:181/1/1/1/1/1/2/799/313
MANLRFFNRSAVFFSIICELSQAKRNRTVTKHAIDDISITADGSATSTYCGLNCKNGGYCTFKEYHDYPIKGNFGFYQACACRPGFHGGLCEKIVEECVAPHYKCNNGAPCKQSDGKLVCDCSFADEISTQAGVLCRDTVTTSCKTRDASIQSFCTNGGVCLSSNKNAYQNLMFKTPTTHEGCKCVAGFEGDHCEQLKNMPQSSLVVAEMNVAHLSHRNSAKAKTGVSIVLVIVACIFSVMLVRRKNRQRNSRNDSEERFNSFYMDTLAEDLGRLGRAEEEEPEKSDGGMIEEEYNEDDMESVLESIEDSQFV